MLKIFNKTKKAVQTVFQEPKDPAVLVAEIHREFDEASTKVIDEYLSGSSIKDGGKVLYDLGFTANKKAKDYILSDLIENNAKALVERVEYCKTYYPNYKFITLDAVRSICKRYGLLFGPAVRFVGEIPAKNVKEMVAFKLREEDFTEHKCVSITTSMMGELHGYYTWDPFNGKYFVDVEDKEVWSIKEREPFLVCAPKKDFNTTGVKISEDGVTVIPQDPIVLQPLPGEFGGYLIVTKWGPEASDPSLTNETMN